MLRYLVATNDYRTRYGHYARHHHLPKGRLGGDVHAGCTVWLNSLATLQKTVISLNCLLISVIMSSAALPTDFMVMAATTKGRAAPIRVRLPPLARSGSVCCLKISTGLECGKRARAVKAALPSRIPYRLLRLCYQSNRAHLCISLTSSPRPDISAIPPALSATGP